MSFNGAGLGAAGTRVTKKLGIDDEVWAYILQAIVGAGALDLVLTLTLLSYVIIGWWSMILFLCLTGFLVGVIVLAFGRPQWKPLRWVMGNLWAIGAGIGAWIGYEWFSMLQLGTRLIAEQIGVIFGHPWWIYVALFLALAVIAIWGHWKASVAILIALPVVAVLLLSDADEWIKAWDNLKFLLIPYSWPVIGFALLLALVMGKEMLFPSLEWTFKPVSLEELREVGLIGLWAPGLFAKSAERVPFEGSERRVRVESKENAPGELAEETYTYLPDSDSARDFYRALSKGAPFTISEARRWHVGRRTFEKKIRNVFLDRGWAEWKDGEHHDQGIKLTTDGSKKVEALVLGDPRH